MKNRLFYCISILLFLILVSAGNVISAVQEESIEVKTVSSFAYCCISHVGPFADIESVISQLFPVMQSQNIPPAGTMMGVYYSDPELVAPEDLRWEIGFPCTSQVSPLKPLEKKIWSYKLVASAIHTGPYENTGETYAKIFEWMEANGYEQAGPVLEKYLSMPSDDADPATLKAEIWIPVNKK